MKQPKIRCRELETLKGKEYDYLGHMRKKEFQQAGHNFDSKRLLQSMQQGFGGIANTMGYASMMGGGGSAPKPGADPVIDNAAKPLPTKADLAAKVAAQPAQTMPSGALSPKATMPRIEPVGIGPESSNLRRTKIGYR